MAQRYRLHDRRGPDRPSNGDTAPCPDCRWGTLEFNERYRVALTSGKTAIVPAWICDRAECRYGRPVRKRQRRLAIHASSVSLRAGSNRQLMKARSVVQRAGRALSKSLARRKKKH
jgi:hypothetical protein